MAVKGASLKGTLEGGRLVCVTRMGVAVVFLEMGVFAEGTSLEVEGMLLRRLDGG